MWTLEEDDRLILIMQNPPIRYDKKINWTLISMNVMTRTAKQCRERWTNVIDPSINKKAWTTEDDVLLDRMVKRHGKQWKKISLEMNRRNANDIKNRWNMTNHHRYMYLKKDFGALLHLSHIDIYNVFS